MHEDDALSAGLRSREDIDRSWECRATGMTMTSNEMSSVRDRPSHRAQYGPCSQRPGEERLIGALIHSFSSEERYSGWAASEPTAPDGMTISIKGHGLQRGEHGSLYQRIIRHGNERQARHSEDHLYRDERDASSLLRADGITMLGRPLETFEEREVPALSPMNCGHVLIDRDFRESGRTQQLRNGVRMRAVRKMYAR